MGLPFHNYSHQPCLPVSFSPELSVQCLGKSTGQCRFYKLLRKTAVMLVCPWRFSYLNILYFHSQASDAVLVGPEQMAAKRKIWNVNKLARQDRWRVEELFTFQSGAWVRSGQGHLQQRQWWQSPPTNPHLVEPLPWCDPPASPHLFSSPKSLFCVPSRGHGAAGREPEEMSCLSGSRRS